MDLNINILRNYNKTNNTRLCKECNKWLDLSKFSTRIIKGKKNIQVRELCKSCQLKKLENVVITPEQRRNRYRKDPRKNMLSKAKQRAKDKNMDFNITIDDLIIPEYCPLLNIPINVTIGKISRNSPTLDRIDNTKGYIKGNIWIISKQANTIKSDASLAELELLVNNLKGSCINRMNCKNAEMPTCSQAIDHSIEGSETTGEKLDSLNNQN